MNMQKKIEDVINTSLTLKPTDFHEVKKLSEMIHPLAQYLPYSLELKPDTFVLDDLICDQITLIAGSPGVGKTSQLVPLFTRVAWLCDEADQLKPRLRRKVIYVAEDTSQVIKILSAMRTNGDLGQANQDDIRDWFRVVSAKRLSAESIVLVNSDYRELAFRNERSSGHHFYDAMPLVVFDTANATLELESENDNAEVGHAIALLKNEFQGVPIVVVAHVAKSLKRSDIADFSVRGAGAFEGDCTQVCYLIKDDKGNDRWLEIGLGKHRFTAIARGIRFSSRMIDTVGEDVLGIWRPIRVHYGLPELVDSRSLADERSAKAEQEAKEQIEAKRTLLLEAVSNLWKKPIPSHRPNKSGIFQSVGGKKAEAIELVDTLTIEGWLLEVPIPSDMRPHPLVKSIYCRLDESQRTLYHETGNPPVTEKDIPSVWLKPSIGSQSVEAIGEPMTEKSLTFEQEESKSCDLVETISSVPESSVPLKKKTAGTDDLEG